MAAESVISDAQDGFAQRFLGGQARAIAGKA